MTFLQIMYITSLIITSFYYGIAYADSPVPWQFGFQDSASPIMDGIIELHHKIFFYLVIIFIFVGWMLIRIIWHFNHKRNSIPSKVSHASLIEVIWTLVPCLILLLIALPSFEMLYAMDEVIDPAITIKAIGHQWYWSYEYSDYNSLDEESLSFDSYMIPDDELQEGQLRLLDVDERVVIPTDTHVRLIITSGDVLHAWALPSAGVKLDAVPGRLNQASLFINREGVYYGQCSELCGVKHGFMPIVVQAVSLPDYISWISNKIQMSKEIIKAA